MYRERIAWVFCTVAVVILAAQITAVSSTPVARDDDYAFVRTLVDLQRQISGNYVKPVDPEKLRAAAINGMLEELDPFTVYVPASKQEDFDRLLEGTFKGVGVQLNQLDNGDIEVVTPVDGSPAFKAGVMAGDVILKVNDQSVAGLRMSEAIKQIAGPLGSEVKLTVRRATGETLDLSMTREEIVIPTVRGWARNPDNTWDWYVRDDPRIAYLRVTQFTPETYDAAKAALEQLLRENVGGVVMDLRFNPGGRLDQALKLIDLLLESGTMLSTKGSHRPEQFAYARAEDTLPRFPLIVLVNEHSASASEIVAGSLMDNRRALVVGQRTYGKGSVQEVVPLEQDGGELKMTVAYYYLPSGRRVHREKDATDWGVEPNIVVEMDEQAQIKLQRERFEAELFRRPTTKPTSQPSGEESLDPQLQRAVDTMTALLVLGDRSQLGAATTRPSR